MSNTILKRRWSQGKKSITGTWKTSFIKKPSERTQKKNSVRKLHEIIQELTYGATKDAIEKKLAYANRRWMKTFYKNIK